MPHVVITGARSGIGKELVLLFAEAGWRVTAVCRREEDFPEDARGELVHPVSADLAQRHDIDALPAKLEHRPVDVLFNGAGVYDSKTNSVDDDHLVTSMEELSSIFQVNTIAPRLLADALLPQLLLGREKLVVTISSGMGTHAKMDTYHAAHWPYSASKAAVNYAMAAFGLQHPEITSVLIHPGWVRTKIGGEHAPLAPAESAQAIFGLITEKRDSLQSGKLVEYTGVEMAW